MLKIRFSACLLITFACQMISISAQSQSRPAGKATVSGQVLVKGEPVPGVTVALLPEQPVYPEPGSLSLRANSDENGRFRITGIKAGRYYLTVLAAGFMMAKDNDRGRWGRVINIAEGENVENQDIPLLRGGVIAGRVIDSEGRPVGEESLRLTVVDENGKRQQLYYDRSNYHMFETDDRGFYRLYGLPEGRYLISVGYAQHDVSSYTPSTSSFYPLTYHPDATEESEAKVIEVREGSEQTGVDIKVSAPRLAHDVFGRVIEADTGQPVAGAIIMYGLLVGNDRRIGFVTYGRNRTDAQGGFQLSSIKPGKYHFSARFEGESDFYSEVAEGEVGEGTLRGVEIKVRRGCSIKGVTVIEGANDPVLQEKLKRLQIHGSYRSAEDFLQQGPRAFVKPDGTFQLRGIRPGKVYLNMSQNWDVMGFAELRVENNGIPAPDGLELKPGEQLNNIRFIVGYGKGVIRGEMKIVGGERPEDVRMIVHAQRIDASPPGHASGEVDSRGYFQLEHLLPGKYELRLSAYSRGQTNERIARIQRLASGIRQFVQVTNTTEAKPTITIDLSQKEEKNER